MSIEAGIYTYLKAQSSITDLVSTRIYPGQAPETATRPYIVHNAISEQRYPNVGGPSGMVRMRLQIDIFADTRDSAQSVFAALRDKLDGFRHSTMGSEDVLSVNFEDLRTDLIAPTDGADPGVQRISTDWIVLYGETGTSV